MASNEIKHLSEEFLYILYNAAIKKSYLCGILTENMKSEYLPDKQFQILQRTMALYFKSHKSSPSFGVIKEKLRDDLDTIELIETIADTKYKESDEVIINTLEEYIKDVKLKNLYAKIPQYYNKGQSDKAQEEIKQYAEWMNSFSLNASKFISVIDTFKVRYEENVKTIEEMKQDNKPLVSRFYIPELDFKNGGRSLRTQLSCFLASTGVGKSHIARHIGARAAIDDGLDALHFQLEGSEKEVVDAYSGALIEKSSYLYERGRFTEKEIEEFDNKVQNYSGNIDVRSFQRFNNKVSTVDIKNGIEEYKKIYGKAPDIVIIDSMDLLEDSSGKTYDAQHERAKRIAVANDLKDLAGDEDIWIVVTYQSTIENRDWLNDEKNVLTEYNCAEAKGLSRPMTHIITLNQSDNERNEHLMRLHVAKSRFFKKGDTIRIATDYENEVFYDHKRSINLRNIK